MALNWGVVATFLHRAPADVIWSVLDGHGIPAQVRGDDAGGFAGLALGEVTVEVPRDRADEAREVLATTVEDGPT